MLRIIFLQSNNFGLIHPPCIPCSINLTIITLKKNINNPNFSPTVSRLGQGSSRAAPMAHGFPIHTPPIPSPTATPDLGGGGTPGDAETGGSSV